jgi:hypothetical protein
MARRFGQGQVRPALSITSHSRAPKAVARFPGTEMAATPPKQVSQVCRTFATGPYDLMLQLIF